MQLKSYLSAGIKRLMPDKCYLSYMYHKKFGLKCNFKDPKSFTEKMQWLKLHDRNDEYTVMVDKQGAKEYVAQKLDSSYIIPTIGVWDSFDQIDFDSLPDKFVLKCTHDSGGLVIVTDKSIFNKEAAREKINRCLGRNYFYSGREWPYKNVKPRIIAEEYLENNKEGLHDYKIWCFNGEPLYIQYVTGRVGNQTYDGFYDLDWNLQDIEFINPHLDHSVPKPSCLEKMLNAARVLAKGRPFLRCDFYVLEDGSIRFGEMTFYPMSGFQKFKPDTLDMELGEKLACYAKESV